MNHKRVFVFVSLLMAIAFGVLFFVTEHTHAAEKLSIIKADKKKLNREENALKNGRYDVDLKLLSPDEIAHWEKERQMALQSWGKEANHLTASVTHRAEEQAFSQKMRHFHGNGQETLTSIQSNLTAAYQEELQAKIEALNKNYQQHVAQARTQIEESLRSFGNKMLQFRSERMEARRVELAQEFERNVKTHASELDEISLEFEKKIMQDDQTQKLALQLKMAVATPSEKNALEDQLATLENSEEKQKSAKQEELRNNLSSYRDKELVRMADTLKTEAADFDRQALSKIKQQRDELIAGTQEALLDEQQSLNLQLNEYRKALKTAKQTQSSYTLAAEGQANIKSQAKNKRVELESKLVRDEATIISSAKRYQASARVPTYGGESQFHR